MGKKDLIEKVKRVVREITTSRLWTEVAEFIRTLIHLLLLITLWVVLVTLIYGFLVVIILKIRPWS